MTAYARLLEGGPETSAECPLCGLIENHARTEDAQAAVRAHNRLRHAPTEES